MDDEAMLGGGGRHALPQPLELDSGIAGAAVRFGRHLDLGLQKLPPDAAGGTAVRG